MPTRPARTSASGPRSAADDPEVAADLAEARASGTLARRPGDAWGNAAIPGFGIGRPVVEPLIDPAANALPLAAAEEAAKARRTFEIAPETLVIAASDEVPLLIAHGVPGAVVERGQTRFIVGLLGAILAIVSAMVLAIEPQRRVRHVSRRSSPRSSPSSSCSAIVGYIVLASYNAIVALRQRIDKAWSNIGVVLKQRHDQLPNLVAAVRGLMAYEHDVLTRVTEARAAYYPDRPDPRPGGDFGGDDRGGTHAVRRRRALPGHQGPQNVLDLQDEIERLEGMIADRRELYNDQVYRYNTRIAQVPGALIAPAFGWRQREFFAADPAETLVPPRTWGPTDDRADRSHPRQRWHRRTCGSSAMARPSGRASAATPGGPTSR